MGSQDWIENMNMKKGSFSGAAKKAGKSTAEYAQEKSGAKGKLGRRARLAQTLMAASKGSK